MKLLSLSTEGVRGLPDRSFDFSSPKTGQARDLVLVTGPACCGKTSLLEAVIAAKESIGPYGPRPDVKAVVHPRARSAVIRARWQLTSAEMERARASSAVVSSESIFGDGAPVLADHDPALVEILSSYSHDPRIGKLEYFPADRTLPRTILAAAPARRATEASERRLRPLRDPDKYRSVRQFLIQSALEESTALAETVRARGVALGSAVSSFTAELRRRVALFVDDAVPDGIDGQGTALRARFVRRDGSVLDLDELAESERQSILFAATSLRLGLSHSLVLVDMPELHVHPDEHPRVIRALSRMGEDNQVIAATSSSAILAAVERSQIVELPARAA